MTDRTSRAPRAKRLAAPLLGATAAILLVVVAGCPNHQPAKPAGSGTGAQPSTTSGGTAYVTDKPFDPIAENGPIFEGWTKPKLTLVFTGEQHGYFEPCGCTGPGKQKGGMSRRYSFLEKLRADGWNPVPIDLGGLSRAYGQPVEVKLQTSVDALAAMKYQAIGLGGEDLRFPADFLLSTAGDETFISANVVVLGNESRFRVIEAAGEKIGVTSVVAGRYRDELADTIDPGIVIEDPVEALEKVVPQLREAGAQRLVLLAYAPREVAEELAKKFPDFEYVVAAGGPDVPPSKPIEIPGSKTQLLQVGQKGMYAVAIGLYDGAPAKYQSVPLDSRFPDSPEMHNKMVEYQDQLKALGWPGLNLSPSLHSRAKSADDPDAQFVGADACGKCHTKAFAVWSKSKHAHATQTLIELDPPRQFDPECISCHATGWNPESYSPYMSGFTDISETPHLSGNSCENCHGPGSGHVNAEKERDPKRRLEMRTRMRLNLGVADQQVCRQCHDHDNSPNFDFSTYWEKIKHPGKN